MNRFFHAELTELRADLLRMGDLVLQMLRDATTALADGDRDLAERVRSRDDEVDALERRIDHEVVRYLTLFSPLGRDIRLLLTARDLGREFERIADESTVIARRVAAIHAGGEPFDPGRIPDMARLVEAQVRLALESFATRDASLAESVLRGDASIDALHRENVATTFASGAGVTPRAVELLFVSKGLERIGDHAENIGEQVIFLTSGEDVRHGGR